MNKRPETAEPIISLPWFSLSGLPAEVVTIKVPKRIRSKAIPPPKPMASSKKLPTKPPDATSVEIQPRAVSIPLSPLGVIH